MNGEARRPRWFGAAPNRQHWHRGSRDPTAAEPRSASKFDDALERSALLNLRREAHCRDAGELTAACFFLQ